MLEKRVIENQFFQFIENNGIMPRNRNLNLIMDGKIHRFAVEEDRRGKTSGAYIIHPDEWPAWGAMDYHQHNEMIKGKFNPDNLRDYEQDEFFSQVRKEKSPQIQSKKDEEKQRQEQRQKEIRDKAIINARQEYNNTRNSCTSEHPYLKLKHIYDSRMLDYQGRIKTNKQSGDYGLIGDLMIPLENAATGKFQSMQLIRANLDSEGKYQKGIYKGTQLTGACFKLTPYENKKQNLLLICEGVATAASLFKAFNFEIEIIAAMSCHNIINVAKAFREKSQNREIIIAADNDQAGIKAAEATVKKGYADTIKLPPEQGKDWNDHYIQKGTI